MYSAGTGGTDILYWTSSDQIAVDAPALSVLVSNDRFRDPSAWYHIVMAVDATNGTNSNRTRIYVNNREITSWATDARGSLTSNKYLTNSTERHTLGIRSSDLSSTPYKGYESEFYLVDGQQLTPSDFGEYDDNGVWRPIEYTGTFGTNGCYLKFDPSATNGIGHDHSGNGNNWTPSGFDTTNTTAATYDVMSDTPTNNFATLNPLAVTPSTPDLSDGNLQTFTTSSHWGSTFATQAIPSSGKWYFEVVTTGSSSSPPSSIFGLSGYEPTTNRIYAGAKNVLYEAGSGRKYVDGTSSTYGATYGINDVIGVACDVDGGTVQFYKNGVGQGSLTYQASGLFPAASDGADNQHITAVFNFGQRSFAQTPPSGYLTLCTANLPAPDIADGSEYFNTVLYTGNGSTQSITGVGFQPDWVWTKKRSGSQDHFLYDVVRGSTNGNFYELRSSSTAAEGVPSTASTGLTSLDSDGFSIGSDGSVNTNNDTYVA